MESDTHVCVKCHITFTSLEDYARHKYTVHQLRFTMTKSFSEKPNIFFPVLVKKPPSVNCEDALDGKISKIEKKRRMTFNKQLVVKGKSQSVTTAYQCSLCPRGFRNQKSLVIHRRNAHQVFRCDLCPEAEQYDIIGEESYDEHVIAHTWKYACSVCHKRYQSKGGMKYHLQTHTNRKITASKVRIGERTEQTPESDAEQISDQVNIQTTQLSTQHHQDNQEKEEEEKNIHGKQQIETNTNEPSCVIMCNVCSQFYETAPYLLQHLISDHITLTPHRCDLCRFSCSKRSSLRSHMLRVHDKELPPHDKLDGLEIDHEGDLIFEMNVVAQSEENEEPRIERIQIITNQEQSAQSAMEIRMQSSQENANNQAEMVISEDTNDSVDKEQKYLSTFDKTNTPETKDTHEIHTTETRISNQNKKNKSLSMSTGDITKGSRGVCENKQGIERKGNWRGKETCQLNQQVKEDELIKALDQLTAVQAIVDVQFTPEEVLTLSDSTSNQTSHLSKKEKMWTCTICHRIYKRQADLKVHTRKHTGERPFCCKVCKKGFITKDSLKKHSVVHSEERRYKCGECGQLFKRMGHVRTHLLHTHSADKPHACPTCHKHFKTKNSLYAHVKIHSDAKPYSCSVCNKSFREKGTLVRHNRTHTGQKPFVCSECGKAFSENSALLRHRRAKVPCILKKSQSNSRASPALQVLSADMNKETTPSPSDVKIATELLDHLLKTENHQTKGLGVNNSNGDGKGCAQSS